jgi:hypothetical protein
MTETSGSPGEKAVGSPSTAPVVGLPARLNLRRAFDIYVSGRSRSLGPGEKEAVAGGRAETPFPLEAVGGSDLGTVTQATRVSVPAALRFDRGAGKWRSFQSPPKGGSR